MFSLLLFTKVRHIHYILIHKINAILQFLSNWETKTSTLVPISELGDTIIFSVLKKICKAYSKAYSTHRATPA